jgi:DNA ligase D
MKNGDIKGIKITHPDRIIYPDCGVTKRHVADYYATLMDRFLPGVVDRPTSVLRCPEGIGEPGFFQKHPIRGLRHTGHITLKEESGEQDDYMCPRNATSIIELVQFGTIEFHPWAAKASTLDEADYLVFDLDPAPNMPWAEMIEAARLIRGRLIDLALQSFVRTTGGHGLHVVVPLHSSCHWNDAKRFTQAFAHKLQEDQPEAFTASASKIARKGKIFIDYLRNSRGATSVASYSLRARTGAPVAMPLRWSELGTCRSGQDFDIRSARRRVSQLRSSPWDGFKTICQDLGKAFKALDLPSR